jgi:hypothetical protein
LLLNSPLRTFLPYTTDVQERASAVPVDARERAARKSGGPLFLLRISQEMHGLPTMGVGMC